MCHLIDIHIILPSTQLKYDKTMHYLNECMCVCLCIYVCVCIFVCMYVYFVVPKTGKDMCRPELSCVVQLHAEKSVWKTNGLA